MDKVFEDDLVSVIIPIYNTEEYLSRCLDSILNNSYNNLEIICVNDGSTDESGHILNIYRQKDNRIRVIDKDNEGVSAARNTGLDAANGNLIAFIDSDDWIHPDYFSLLVQTYKLSRADVISCDCQMCSADLERYGHMEDVKYNIIKDPYAVEYNGLVRHVVWGKLYTKSIIDHIRFNPNLSNREDTEFNRYVFANIENLAGRGIAHLSVKIYFYYQRQDSLSHTKKNIDFVTNILDNVKNMNTGFSLIQEYFLRVCKELLAYRYGEQYNTDFKKTNEMCDEVIRDICNLQEQYRYMKETKWLIIRVLFACPELYRIGRIIDDPTLLKWEKSLKKKK